MGVPPVARWRVARGRTHDRTDDLAAIVYRHSQLPFELLSGSCALLEGLDVAEIGPGDSIAAGLLVLAAGARSYTAMDRFAGDIRSPFSKKLYAATYEWAAGNPDWRATLKSRIPSPYDFPEGYPELVKFLPLGAEQLCEGRGGLFDAVFSNWVWQHMYDIDAAAKGLFHSMKPGAISIHRVDFGPVDVWSGRPDPLEWLTVPEPIWNAMGSNRGTPNRYRLHQVADSFRRAGFIVSSEVTKRFPEAAVTNLLNRYPARFGQMPRESIEARLAILKAEKPADLPPLPN